VVRLLGVTGTLLLIPLMLGGAIVAFVAAPAFLSMAVAKVVSKALDYSLFRAAKEMLYLPLSYAEQTQGKAVVDILTYRVAKGATSGLLLVLAMVGAPAMAASVAALVLVVAWVAMTVAIVRRYSRRMAGGA
jgi:AAA family ATP:ADP antiporter